MLPREAEEAVRQAVNDFSGPGMSIKIAMILALAGVAALALGRFLKQDDEAALGREAAGQLDALREHLFRTRSPLA